MASIIEVDYLCHDLTIRHARGFLARRKVKAALGVALEVDPIIMEIAERHLVKGRLWMFLRDVDLEIKRVQREAAFTRRREQEMSDMFIKKVGRRP